MTVLLAVFGCHGVDGEFTITLVSAHVPEEICPQSDWGSDEPEPDLSIKVELVWDDRSWASSVAEPSHEPVWDEPVFDGVGLSADSLMTDGLVVKPLENDLVNGEVYGSGLEEEIDVLETSEIKARAFDVVAGCITIDFTLDRP